MGANWPFTKRLFTRLLNNFLMTISLMSGTNLLHEQVLCLTFSLEKRLNYVTIAKSEIPPTQPFDSDCPQGLCRGTGRVYNVFLAKVRRKNGKWYMPGRGPIANRDALEVTDE